MLPGATPSVVRVTTRRSARGLLATAVISAAVLATALTGCAAAGQAAPPTAGIAAADRPGTAAKTPAPVTAVAIGDSIAIGNGVPADDAWPLLVADHFDWTLSDFAESAAGFTVEGLNTHTFDDQVSAAIRVHPDVVLIGGTRNDLFAPTSTLEAAATAALERLRAALPHARIIGIGPLWGSDPAPAQIAVIDNTVKAAVLGVGGSWVEVGQPFAGRPDLVQKDRIHPTVTGQRMLAEGISNRIRALLFQR